LLAQAGRGETKMAFGMAATHCLLAKFTDGWYRSAKEADLSVGRNDANDACVLPQFGGGTE